MGLKSRGKNNNIKDKEIKDSSSKDKYLFGYGDTGLLIFLAGFISFCLWNKDLSNQEMDMAIFILGVPVLLVALIFGIKGRRQPAGIATLLFSIFYFGIFLLLFVLRAFHS